MFGYHHRGTKTGQMFGVFSDIELDKKVSSHLFVVFHSSRWAHHLEVLPAFSVTLYFSNSDINFKITNYFEAISKMLLIPSPLVEQREHSHCAVGG